MSGKHDMWKQFICMSAAAIWSASISDAAFAQTQKPPEIVWEKTLGGRSADQAVSIVALPDGGFAMAGTTESFGAGDGDVWVVRFGRNGRIVWEKTFGGPGFESAAAIVALPDGGFAIAGSNFSVREGDIWVLRLDAAGRKLWGKTYGGPNQELATAIAATKDGGVAVAGWKDPGDGGGVNAWILRLDGTGLVLWEKTSGGRMDDQPQSIAAVPDGGFIVAGETKSKGAGKKDAWVYRLDQSGKQVWDRTFGGPNHEAARAVLALSNKAFVIAGWKMAKEGSKTKPWVFRLDGQGRVVWEKSIGGLIDAQAGSIAALPNGGFLVAGSIDIGAGPNALVLALDSAGRLLWKKTSGGTEWDWTESVAVLRYGGFIVAGITKSKGAGKSDAWLMRFGPHSSK